MEKGETNIKRNSLTTHDLNALSLYGAILWEVPVSWRHGGFCSPWRIQFPWTLLERPRKVACSVPNGPTGKALHTSHPLARGCWHLYHPHPVSDFCFLAPAFCTLLGLCLLPCDLSPWHLFPFYSSICLLSIII